MLTLTYLLVNNAIKCAVRPTGTRQNIATFRCNCPNDLFVGSWLTQRPMQAGAGSLEAGRKYSAGLGRRTRSSCFDGDNSHEQRKQGVAEDQYFGKNYSE